LAAFAAVEQLPRSPAIAALLGSNVLPTPGGAATANDRPTFIILGTIEARKNHLMLLHVWTRLVQLLGPDAPRLLIIGQRGWECERVFNLLDRSDDLKCAVTEIGHCDDGMLAQR